MFPTPFREATFIERRNRFLVLVEVNGRLQEAHLPNSGRLEELLIPGRKALVREVPHQGRKTRWDLWAIYTAKIWVCVDARHANDLFLHALHCGLIDELRGFSSVEREVGFDRSRLDFAVRNGNDEHLVEVKSVTLVRDGTALFPDAPTERGKRHLETLARAMKTEQRGGVAFMVQREDASVFSPNKERDPAFAAALQEAVSKKVWVAACKFVIGRGWVGRGERIPVVL